MKTDTRTMRGLQESAKRALPEKQALPGGTRWTRREFSLAAAAMLAAAGLPSAEALAVPAPAAPCFPLAGHAEDPFTTLLEYRPRHDPDAPYFRSFVRRARQIAPLRATQAHPSLDPRPQLASLTGCYRSLGAEPTNRYKTMRYGAPPPDGVFVSRQLGSHDIVVSWDGPGMIPNPALTDAAHRNGALCLGTVFQPDHRMYDGSAVPPRRTARQLVSFAEYFGFDGYFVNFENGTPAQHAMVEQWIGMMRDEAGRRGLTDFYIQFYDGSADMEQLLPPRTGSAGSYADSTMLDQGWSGYSMTHGCCSGAPTAPQAVAAYCAAHGFDRFGSAFFGFQLYPGPGYLGLAAPAVVSPNSGGHAYGSLQIYSWDDGLYNLLAFEADSSGPAPDREQAFYRLERLFFNGQSGNPALENAPSVSQAEAYATVAAGTRRYTGYTPGSPRMTDQMRLPITYGVANFIAERSVVGELPFVSRFNVGTGQGFFLDGRKVSGRPWFHLGAQDILPTWQWWQSPMNGRHAPDEESPNPLVIDFDQTAAWNGGSSLRITGTAPAEGVAVHLYKTSLAVHGELCVQMVWRDSGTVPLRCGLVFVDAPADTVWMEAEHAEDAGEGWKRATFPLAPYAGRTAAALAIGFAAAGTVDLFLGEVYLGPAAGQKPSARPKGFRVEGHRTTPAGVQARLRWHLDERAAYYDVFAQQPRGLGRQWLGRVTADCFYVEDAAASGDGAGGEVEFALVAVDRETPLMPSAPAIARGAAAKHSA